MSKHTDDVMTYCKDVVEGRILTNRYCLKAVERFLNDLENKNFDYYLDTDKADEVINFAETLVIPDIEKTPDNPKRQLRLLPWQKFIYYNLFGFRKKSDHEKRRFQDCYIEVARKNSKTTSLLFPMILYDLVTTNAAEAYFVNKDLQQSEKSFKELKRIIEADSDLMSLVEMNSQAIVCKNSRIAFFCDDSSAIDGYKNSLSVIDEYHCYDSDKIVTAFRYGGRSRKNRLIVKITSAGLDISKPCYSENQAAKKLLDGLHTDETYFCIIFAYDDEDDWKDPKMFQKANPSLNLLPALTDEVLMSDMADALAKPSHQPDFKSKTCGIWTNGVSSWIPLNILERGTPSAVDFESLKGETCGLAFDLSDINDLTCLTATFKIDGNYIPLHQAWIPEEKLYEKYASDNINILSWVENGLIQTIPGATIQDDYVFEKIAEWIELYNVCALYYDPWQAKELIKKLEENFPKLLLVPFGQSLKNFSPVTKEFERLVYNDQWYETNPVALWCDTNAIVKPDVNGNYKPLKPSKASTKRIDLCITSIMSRAALDEQRGQPKKKISFNTLLNSF